MLSAVSDSVNTLHEHADAVLSSAQATVRPARNGVYKSGCTGEVNFNGDLARPILDGISMQWERLFGTTVIERLKYAAT